MPQNPPVIAGTRIGHVHLYGAKWTCDEFFAGSGLKLRLYSNNARKDRCEVGYESKHN